LSPALPVCDAEYDVVWLLLLLLLLLLPLATGK